MEAYEQMIQETATKDAPRYVVPADNKWFTRVVVGAAVIDAICRSGFGVSEGGCRQTQGARRCEKEVVEQVAVCQRDEVVIVVALDCNTP